MTGLMVGLPPRSSCSRVPSSRRRLIEAQTPITGPPSMAAGTSSAMESTLLPAKSSCPVQANPCRAPYVGEERVAAQPGGQPDPVYLHGLGHAVEADRDVRGEYLADRFGLAGLGAGGVPGGSGLPAVPVFGEYEGERDVGQVVAVGVDVDPVHRARVELPPGGGRRGRGRGA